MWKEMKERKISMKRFKHCLKLYLSFERWVNEPHPRSKVHHSSKVLGDLINLIKECFPRDEGWGWNLPKIHAFAKMPLNMLHNGSANNFSGNIREQVLRELLKIMQKKHKDNQINFQNNVLYASMKAMFSIMLRLTFQVRLVGLGTLQKVTMKCGNLVKSLQFIIVKYITGE
jgi:hypothetical protein